MKYINLDNFYMVDDYNNFLRANPYLDYSKENLDFRENDIAYVRLKHFKALAPTHYEVEIHNKKEFVEDENFFVISDSPLTILFRLMEYRKFDEFDLMPILRLKHFKIMMNRLKEEPKDLSQKKGLLGSLFKSKTEYVALFFNEETQEVLADYLILDQDNPNENIFAEHAENGFFPVYFETKIKTEVIYEEFINILNKKIKLPKQNYYIHPYNSIGGRPYTEYEKNILQKRYVALKANLIQEYNNLKEKLLNNQTTLNDCIETFEIKAEIFNEENEAYEDFKKKYCFEVNIVTTINLLTLGEYSWEQLDEMQLIYARTLKEMDDLKLHQKEYLLLINETIKSFKEEASKGFK